VVLHALLDLDPLRRPSAITTARRLADEAVEVDMASTADTGGRSSTAKCSNPAATAELAPDDEAGDNPPPSRRTAGVEAQASDGADDAMPGNSQPSARRAGHHRMVLTAWRRPSRRVVLAGLLGVVGMVALATGPDPEPPATPSAAPSLGQAAPPSPPLAGPPIVPDTPSTVTSTPFDEVASAAPTRSERRAPTSAQTTADDDRERAPVEDREEGHRDDDQEAQISRASGDPGWTGGSPPCLIPSVTKPTLPATSGSSPTDACSGCRAHHQPPSQTVRHGPDHPNASRKARHSAATAAASD
jgi:hypothetical protein